MSAEHPILIHDSDDEAITINSNSKTRLPPANAHSLLMSHPCPVACGKTSKFDDDKIEAILCGVGKHGTCWEKILKDPAFAFKLQGFTALQIKDKHRIMHVNLIPQHLCSLLSEHYFANYLPTHCKFLIFYLLVHVQPRPKKQKK